MHGRRQVEREERRAAERVGANANARTGDDEWHAAPSENDKGHKFLEMLKMEQRKKADDFLIQRGVEKEEDRQRIMRKVLPPPRTKEDDERAVMPSAGFCDRAPTPDFR